MDPTTPRRLQAPERVERIKRSTDEDNDVQRAVIDAIERVLSKVSVHQLSVERILEEAGTSRATFYRNFSSKWSVVAAALERAVVELFDSAEPFLAAPAEEDPLDGFDRATREVLKVYKRHHHVFLAAMQYWQSIPDLRDLWLHFIDQQVSRLAEFISGQRELGRAVPGPPADQLAEVLVWTAVQDYITAGVLYGEDNPENRLVPGVEHLWSIAIYGRSRFGPTES